VPRPAGSQSKIRLVHDGVVILTTILALARDYKPLTFFGGLGLLDGGGRPGPGAVAAAVFGTRSAAAGAAGGGAGAWPG
jgi:hypothetical protein